MDENFREEQDRQFDSESQTQERPWTTDRKRDSFIYHADIIYETVK